MKNQNALIANNEPLLRDLQLFCEVARRSSFIAAATETGLSPAHVSKRIATLETMLGVKLFNRTTRRVNITSDGEATFVWAQKILEDVGAMFDALSGGQREPQGTLRVCTSLRLGREHVAPILSLLRRQYPALEVWVELLDRRVDLIADNFDIDVRVGEVQEKHLIAHRIASSSRVLAAAPDYLLFRSRDDRFGVWRLVGPNGAETVKVTGPMASNHSDIVRQWAHDGHGIIMASRWDVAASLTSGALVQVLPGYHQPADIWAVTAVRSSSSAKVRSCVAFLREQLAQGPYALAGGRAGQ
jgi:LysR family transcriptional activator of dmlA